MGTCRGTWIPLPRRRLQTLPGGSADAVRPDEVLHPAGRRRLRRAAPRAGLRTDQPDGRSYGTRMALVYMRQVLRQRPQRDTERRRPDRVKTPLYHAAGLDLAIRGLIAECAADSACREAAPKLDEEFPRHPRAPRQEPGGDVGCPPGHRREGRRAVVARGVSEALRVMMYSGERNRRVPLLLHRAFEGEFRALRRTRPRQRAQPAAEPRARPPAERHLRGRRGADRRGRDCEDCHANAGGDGRVRGQKRVCGFWPSSDIAPATVSR